MVCFAIYILRRILYLVYLGKIYRDSFLLIIIGNWKIRLSSKIKKSSISVFESRNLLCIYTKVSLSLHILEKNY